MSCLVAYTAALSDGGLAQALESFALPAQKSSATPWCFVEGPTVCDFVTPDRAATLIRSLWLVRLFDTERELTARRIGFDDKQPWRARVIGGQPPVSESTHGEASGATGGGLGPPRAEWRPHALKSGEEHKLMLYGEGKNDGAFREDVRFRSVFSYPGVAATTGARVCLVIGVHATADGPAVVRWVRLCAESESEGE